MGGEKRRDWNERRDEGMAVLLKGEERDSNRRTRGKREREGKTGEGRKEGLAS